MMTSPEIMNPDRSTFVKLLWDLWSKNFPFDWEDEKQTPYDTKEIVELRALLHHLPQSTGYQDIERPDQRRKIFTKLIGGNYRKERIAVILCGSPASGKSTVARTVASELGRAPGAVIAHSDVIRKQLCGVEPTTRLGPDGYGEALSQRVYADLAERCRVVAGTGYAVVADAVFGHSAQRAPLRACASGLGVPFVGVWLDAPL